MNALRLDESARDGCGGGLLPPQFVSPPVANPPGSGESAYCARRIVSAALKNPVHSVSDGDITCGKKSTQHSFRGVVNRTKRLKL